MSYKTCCSTILPDTKDCCGVKLSVCADRMCLIPNPITHTELCDPTSSHSLLPLGRFLVDSMLRCQNKQERKQINETPYQMEKLRERSVESCGKRRSNQASRSDIITSQPPSKHRFWRPFSCGLTLNWYLTSVVENPNSCPLNELSWTHIFKMHFC